VSEHRGAYHVAGARDGGLGVAWAELPGRTFRAARDKRDLPTVGDWVLCDGLASALGGGGAAVIRGIVPRRGLLVRRAAGEAALPQPLAANVDVACIVTSANDEFEPRRLERYLGVVRDGGAAPLIVLSKADLASDPEALVERVRAVAPDVELIATSASAPDGDGARRLRARLAGQTSVLLGSSGVGKSTLLNLLLGAQAQLTAAISVDGVRGRHTTTSRAMFLLAGGGAVIDTPGMRELGAWVDGDEPALDADVEAVAALAASCRFSDCRHAGEPGCAVQAAVARGELDTARLAHAQQLRAERTATAARADARARQDATRKAKVAQRALRDALVRKRR
jgi:ribosome biogenesis GTPase